MTLLTVALVQCKPKVLPVSSDNAANRRVSMVLTGQVYDFLKAVFGKKQYGHSSGGSSP